MPALRQIRRTKAHATARTAMQIAYSEAMHAQAALDDDWDGDGDPVRDRTCRYCGGDGGNPWDDYISECPQCLGEGVEW